MAAGIQIPPSNNLPGTSQRMQKLNSGSKREQIYSVLQTTLPLIKVLFDLLCIFIHEFSSAEDSLVCVISEKQGFHKYGDESTEFLHGPSMRGVLPLANISSRLSMNGGYPAIRLISFTSDLQFED
ncbi:MAG: hypothetical protein H3C64_13600 [Candidatus Kuenenia stuttgartiensis]|nr:hypothetical protein [bacterium]MBW7943384.1 hypothetical protein [Candidatus Kuenenia stuttgartiensis]